MVEVVVVVEVEVDVDVVVGVDVDVDVVVEVEVVVNMRHDYSVKAIYPVTAKTLLIPGPTPTRALLSAVFACRGGLVQPVGYEVRLAGELQLKVSWEDIERLKATYAKVKRTH